MECIIRSGLLVERSGQEPRAGDVAVYCRDGRPTHAASVGSVGKIVFLNSKWGGNEVRGHGLWEAPAMYGDAVRFFVQPKPLDTLKLLRSS
jgi:hypothetical protein